MTIVEEAPVRGGRFLRTPRMLFTASEVEAAVEDLLAEEAFVIDIETTMGRPRNNTLRWVGLGAAGRSYLIPCGHPKGVQTKAEHKQKKAAALLFPPGDPRGMTPGGKPSMRMVEYTVPARFEPPPQQLFPHEVCEIIQPLIYSDAAKIGHNVKFDLMSLAKYYGHVLPPGPYHDTILIRHTLDEDKTSYVLKDLACEDMRIGYRRLPNGDWTFDRRQWAKWYPNLGKQGTDNFGLDVVARYLSKDVRQAWLMFKAFHPLLAKQGVQEVYDFEMQVYPVLMAMEYEGFPVDLSKLGQVKEALELSISRVEHDVWDLAGDQFPLSNTDAKRWVLFGEGKPVFGDSKRQLQTEKNKVVSRTKETQVAQVTKEVLEALDDRGSKVAALLSNWSQLEKLRGTFIEGITTHLQPRGTGYPTIHTSFKQHGTVTGRLSASEPNLQQLPREIKGRTSIRELFVADEGYVLIVADYDQVELRCAAFASQDPEMVRVFIEGQDIHSLAAATMLSISLEEVTKDLRQVGKTQNFGTLYGAGPAKIAAVAGVSIKRAEGFIANYFQTFQGLEAWKRSELRKARKRGRKEDPMRFPPYVAIPPNGRRRRLPDLYHVDDWKVWRAERQAINAYVQGFASNITKLAMIDLQQALAPYDAKMIAQVHDEIVVKAEKHCADEVRDIVVKTMGGVTTGGVPILGQVPLIASADMGRTWAEAKG